MYLSTISTQPVDSIENNFTLEELDGNVDTNMIKRLVNNTIKTSTIFIKDYSTTSIIDLEV